MGLDDKVALVTGGSRGIGAAVSLELARQGCHIAIVDISPVEAAAEVIGRIEEAGRRSIVIQSDVTVFSEAERVAETVLEELGRLDIVICNAGIAAGFSENYAKHRLPGRVLSNVALQQAYKAKKASLQAETGYNRLKAEQDYETVRRLALDKSDLASANMAIKGKNKLYGLEVDRLQTEDTTEQKKLTEKQEAEARRIANIRLKQEYG